jgi:hypothetical protein
MKFVLAALSFVTGISSLALANDSTHICTASLIKGAKATSVSSIEVRGGLSDFYMVDGARLIEFRVFRESVIRNPKLASEAIAFAFSTEPSPKGKGAEGTITMIQETESGIVKSQATGPDTSEGIQMPVLTGKGEQVKLTCGAKNILARSTAAGVN